MKERLHNTAKREGDGWTPLPDVKNSDLAGVYKEVADQIGIGNAYKLYHYFRGQQVTFPLKFYSSDFIAACILADYNGRNVHDIARKYGYSESRVRQILRKGK